MQHSPVDYFGVWNLATQRRNGYDEGYKTVQGLEYITSLIQKDIILFVNHIPTETYQKAIRAHPTEFEKSITDDEARLGATENQPYQSGMSKYHEPEKELEDWEAYKIVMRATTPCYVNPNSMILIPCNIPSITYICAWEKYRDSLLGSRTFEVVVSFTHQYHTCILKNLDILLRNHHILRHADLPVVATVCIIPTTEFGWVQVEYADTAKLLNQPTDPKPVFCINNARTIIVDIVAREKLEEGLQKLHPRYLQDIRFDATQISEVAQRIRSHALRHMPISKVQRAKLYDYIIAACIQWAAMNFKMKFCPSMQDVCDAMSIDYDDLLEPSPRIPEGLTKAKWAEDRIRRFAGGKDWHQRAGTKKEEAKKRRDK